jgi:hypothetical protein
MRYAIQKLPFPASKVGKTSPKWIYKTVVLKFSEPGYITKHEQMKILSQPDRIENTSANYIAQH